MQDDYVAHAVRDAIGPMRAAVDELLSQPDPASIARLAARLRRGVDRLEVLAEEADRAARVTG